MLHNIRLTSRLTRTLTTPALRNALAVPQQRQGLRLHHCDSSKEHNFVQSQSRLAPIGVAAAAEAAVDPSIKPRPKIFDEFALTDRVGIVSGGNRGLGLEMALALCEAGARAIYCLDLPEKPSDDWVKTKEYVEKLGNGSRLEYVSVDVTDQAKVWKVGEEIGDKEKRMDVCIAAAGILRSHTDCLEYPAQQFRDVSLNVFSLVGLVLNFCAR